MSSANACESSLYYVCDDISQLHRNTIARNDWILSIYKSMTRHRCIKPFMNEKFPLNETTILDSSKYSIYLSMNEHDGAE